ncbi:LytR/AlgR family response regulator transcription factor [Bowmanella dokdonensis]|uniref:Response regulator transcription factor n=1 Tax=Bowmanella dokdonensis TaxID=751969 RepID=A0A939DP22_9ALTE|nr:LytTR family DNA-binding domain-containing protein [Bowmanella dokdonensis]MBN7825336.1 response regulator transcription factor [Bowmanella dokdonensis]
MLRYMIVEDEDLACERLKMELSVRPAWHLVAEAREVNEARQALMRHKPQVCFMDINIVGGSGFELVRELQGRLDTRWVFTTAYSEYAAQAFAVNACDYLLKPFDQQRFEAVLGKLEARYAAEQKPLERLAIRSMGHVQFIPVTTIIWIKGAGNYLELHCQDKTYLHRESMAVLEQSLDARQFLRVHRSAMINLDHLMAINSELGRFNNIEMSNGDEVRIGQCYRQSLFRQIGLESTD